LDFVHGLLERVTFEREEFLAMQQSVITFQVFGIVPMHISADFHSRFPPIGREKQLPVISLAKCSICALPLIKTMELTNQICCNGFLS
jgi:hypothetical protein